MALFDIFAASKLGKMWSDTVNASGGAARSFQIFDSVQTAFRTSNPAYSAPSPLLLAVRASVDTLIIQQSTNLSVIVTSDACLLKAWELWPVTAESAITDGSLQYVGNTATPGTIYFYLVSAVLPGWPTEGGG